MAKMSQLLRIAGVVVSVVLALAGQRAASAANVMPFDVAYASDYELRLVAAWGIGSMVVVVNTGTQGLDLSQLRVLSVTDDNAQAEFRFSVSPTSAMVLSPNQAAGRLSTGAQAFFASRGLVPEPNVNQTLSFSASLLNIPTTSAGEVHASATLSIGHQVVTLPFTISYSPSPPFVATWIATNRVHSQLNTPGAIQDLAGQVNQLVGTALNGGQGQSLNAKLDAALKSLSKGNVSPAIDQLQAFIGHAQSLIGQGILSPAQGQPLMAMAQGIIDWLAR